MKYPIVLQLATFVAALAFGCAACAAPPRSAADGADKSLELAGKPATAPAPKYDAELTTYRYPFPVQRYVFVAQRQRLQMAFMDVRPAQLNAPVIVLLH